MTDRRSNIGPGESDYRSAGVDIDAGDALVRNIAGAVRRTHDDRVLRGLGHFGGFYRIGPAGAGATLVASVDGVGTKLKVASLAGQHAGIGHDLVNHCVNDILAGGARPLFFLDYFATGKLDLDVATEVIRGLAAACEAQGIALLGGETAEMPGVYAPGDYDLAGAVVGLVDEDRIIDGTEIRAGDIVLGLPSSGFHTNGYSLIRAALGLNEEHVAAARLSAPLPWDQTKTFADALLEPHRSYLAPVTPALEGGMIAGMAHITGGGIGGNLSRIIPDGLSARINPENWERPAIMEYVAEVGNVPAHECYRVFNMGIGFVIVCHPDNAAEVQAGVPGSLVIGEVEAGGDRKVVIEGVE